MESSDPSQSPSDTQAAQAGADAVSSLVTDAFSRLTALQEGLRRRIDAVAAREAEATRREHELDERASELEKARSILDRREEVVSAFQEMLALMHTAVQEPAPADIMAALDAGNAYEDKAAAAKPSLGLTADEQKAFLAARGSGKSDEQILQGIYAARRHAAAA